MAVVFVGEIISHVCNIYNDTHTHTDTHTQTQAHTYIATYITCTYALTHTYTNSQHACIQAHTHIILLCQYNLCICVCFCMCIFNIYIQKPTQIHRLYWHNKMIGKCIKILQEI